MHLVEGITDEPHQLHTLLLDDGQINLTIRYLAAVEMWVMDVEYLNKNITQLAMVGGSPLLAGQLMPFDFVVTTSHGADPFTTDAFANGRCELWFITPGELAS